jgi:L-cysteine/cystine lyase
MVAEAAALAIADLRAGIPALQGKVYFNYGGQGPLLASARQAIAATYDETDRLGPFSKAALDWLNRRVADLRVTLAELFQTTPDRFALTESTTSGMNVPLWGLDWQPGDRLLLSDAEHYGIWAIAHRLQERFGIELAECPLMHSSDPVATLERHLTDRTRMVLVSHVLWNTGRVMPLAQLADCCHAHDALLISDAAQSAGVLPVNLSATPVDGYAFTGHKWFCGPAGVGALYLSESAQAQIRTTYTGWCGIYATETGADRYEVATSAYPLRHAWQAAIAQHDSYAPLPDRYRQQVGMVQLLWQRLRDLPGVRCLSDEPPAAGLVAFTLAGRTPAEVESALEARSIYIRSMPDPICLRASVHYFTTIAEVDQLVAAIAPLAIS